MIDQVQVAFMSLVQECHRHNLKPPTVVTIGFPTASEVYAFNDLIVEDSKQPSNSATLLRLMGIELRICVEPLRPVTKSD